MWRRGADPDGYVANFVETEQIMQINGYTGSIVQVMFCIIILECKIMVFLISFNLLIIFQIIRSYSYFLNNSSINITLSTYKTVNVSLINKLDFSYKIVPLPCIR